MNTSKRFRRPSPCKAFAGVRPTATVPPSPNPPIMGGPCERSEQGGGPGRAISARNATTHGLFARDVVLPALGEDPAAYEALLEQLTAQLPPRNMLERHYLEQIAAASWRLRRLHRWQAQVYEDATLTEDQRLDKLDKVLRHETALTRQIDRAIRTLNRDLKWLFESRARAEALYQRDLTEQELREEPELGIEVQRMVWRQLRPTPAPDLGDARLDNTAPTGDTQNCQNEPDESQNCQNELNVPATPPPPLLGAGGPPTPTQNCQNEPALFPPHGSADPAMPISHQPFSHSDGGRVPDEGG